MSSLVRSDRADTALGVAEDGAAGSHLPCCDGLGVSGPPAGTALGGKWPRLFINPLRRVATHPAAPSGCSCGISELGDGPVLFLTTCRSRELI